MANQTGIIRFTGKLGDVVGYKRNGKHVLRTLPRKVNQTTATRTAAKKFGVISRMGKLIRQAIVPQLGLRYDGTLVNRVNRALVLGEKAASSAAVLGGRLHMGMDNLTGFSFNGATSLRNILTQAPIIGPDGTIALPAQLLHLTHKATHVEVRAIAVRIDFKQRRVTGLDEQKEIVQLQGTNDSEETSRHYQPFSGVSLSVSAPGKGALFVVLQMRACTMHNGKALPMGDKRYMAADIITVVPQALFQEEPQKANKKQHKHSLPFSGDPDKRRWAPAAPLSEYYELPIYRDAQLPPLLE